MSESPSEVVEGEVVSTEVVVVEPSQTLARIAVSPDQARQMVQDLRAVIDSVLEEGRDWMTIPGTKKPSMLKPGAERLQTFFGLGSRFVDESFDRDPEGAFTARVKCQVTHPKGHVIAESWGFYSQKERRGSNENTVIKMAQKRAHIGAVLTATGTSDHFTQDVEDDHPRGASQEVPKYLQEDKPIEGPHAHAFIQVFMSRTGKSEEEATAWLYRKEVPKLNGQPTMYWTGAKLLHLLTRPPKEGQPQPRTWIPDSPSGTSPSGATPTPSSTPTGESPPSSSDPPSPSTPTPPASDSPGSDPSKELEIPPAMEQLVKAMRASGMPDAMVERAIAEHHKRKAQQDLDERGEWNVGQEPLDESPEFK